MSGGWALGALLAITALASPASALGVGPLQAASEAPTGDGTLGPAAQAAIAEGPLPRNRAAYNRAKRRAAAQAGEPASPATPSMLAPITIRGWDGLFDLNSAPSDSTSAVGTTRYIEMVNRKYAIYNKTSNVPINTGTLGTLGASSGNTFDPQVIWDPQTSRFYYTMDDVISASTNRLALGFSKTASPSNGTTDWCHYFFNYGSDFPDYPKLGDTQDFWLIGSNVFGPSSFLRSDVAWISKPPAGTTCPTASTFKAGVKANIRDPLGGPAFTPVPANQTDTSGTGYVVTRTGSLPSTRLSLHKVFRNADGTANIQSPGSAVVVPSYTVPPNAPQRTGFPNSAKQLDTSDSRPTQAVSAIDPGRSATSPGLWTQHTTATSPASTRSEVRWYEINPVTRTLFQSGKVNSPSYSAFNGAISPDRRVLGTSKLFGQNMVLGFTTSGTGSFPAVRQVSKLGAAAQSAHVLVKSSPGNYSGFDCAGTDNTCRWGDYAGATPDPTSPPPPATKGRVWLVNQYASGVNSTTAANWRTWNWIASP